MRSNIKHAWLGTALVCAASGCEPGEAAEPGLAGSRSALSQTIFSQGFEGSLEGVSVTGACAVSTSAVQSGNAGMRCDDTASVTVAFSAADATGVVVSYARRTARYDAGEQLVAEFSTDAQATWQQLESIGNQTSYDVVSFALGESASGADVVLRLRSNANGFLETFDLDSIKVDAEVDGETPPVLDDDCDGVDDDGDGLVDEDADCGGEGVLLQEGFESGLGAFVPDGVCNATPSAASAGNAGARCDDDAALTTSFSSQGYASLSLSYTARNARYDSGEQLFVEASENGQSWQVLGTLAAQTAFQSSSVSLDASFDQLPNVWLRFRSTASGYYETFDLDEVQVTGVPDGGGPVVDDPCDGIDNDADGQIDEDFASQPTVCGVGACAAQGQTVCVDGSILDDCSPFTPEPNDPTCDGVDDDCDGAIDEDAVCGPSIQVNMGGDAGAFFDMPWPSDHRRQTDGRPDWAGYPGLEAGQYGVGLSALESMQASNTGFGTSSAVFFTTTGDLNEADLPDAVATMEDGSPVMLVNLDDPGGPRVPVQVDYEASAAHARPARVLAVLPYPGFALEPDTRYAAILFDHLPARDGALVASPLLAQLDAGQRTGTGLSAADFAMLQGHKQEVDAYVASHTSLTPSDVAAFTVYTTRSIGAELFGVARSIREMSDAEVVSRVSNLWVSRSCAETCPAGSTGEACQPATLGGAVRTPIYMTPVEFELNLTSFACLFRNDCMSSSGGLIELDSQGRAELQSWPALVEDTPIEVVVPCTGQRPADGWPVLFRAAGTGGSHTNAERFSVPFLDAAGESFPFVAAGIAPWGTYPRRDPELSDTVETLLLGLTGSATSQEVDGYVFTFLHNPTVIGSNAVQSAGDALFIKRVLGLLPQLASDPRLSVDLSELGRTLSDLETNAAEGTLDGQSQGSIVAPLTLSIPPAQGGYRHAYLNGTGNAAFYDYLTVRADARGDVEGAFELDSGEFTRFHPIAQFLSAGSEVSHTVNYARFIETQNLLITAGAEDGCTVREDAAAFVTSLYRYGRIEAVETQLAFDLNPGLAVRPTIGGVEDVLGRSPVSVPVSGNLPEGGTGVYMLLEGDHFGSGSQPEVGRFLDAVAEGRTPAITTVDFSGEPRSSGSCGAGRYEP